MGKLGSIQVLRAVAVIGVVVMHAGGPAVGAAGVDLFFVISGYIMAIVAPGRSARAFIVARFRRIFPLYWIAALPFLVGLMMTGGTIGQWLATLTLWPVYDGIAFSQLPPAWSLSFELLFYLGVAFGVAMSRWLVVVFLALALVLNSTLDILLFRFIGSPLALEFVGGMALTRLPKVAAAWPLLIGGAAVALSLSPLASGPVDPFAAVMARFLWWGLPSLALVYAAHSVEFAPRPLVFVGDASYSIYLFHILPSKLIHIGWWPGKAAIILTIGIGFYLLIERRLLRRSVHDLPPSPRRLAA